MYNISYVKTSKLFKLSKLQNKLQQNFKESPKFGSDFTSIVSIFLYSIFVEDIEEKLRRSDQTMR